MNKNNLVILLLMSLIAGMFILIHAGVEIPPDAYDPQRIQAVSERMEEK